MPDVIHLCNHNAPANTPLATSFHPTKRQNVTPVIITKTLKTCVTFLGPELGFLAADVSAPCCLRAAGVNALFLLAHVDTDIIVPSHRSLALR